MSHGVKKSVNDDVHISILQLEIVNPRSHEYNL